MDTMTIHECTIKVVENNQTVHQLEYNKPLTDLALPPSYLCLFGFGDPETLSPNVSLVLGFNC